MVRIKRRAGRYLQFFTSVINLNKLEIGESDSERAVTGTYHKVSELFIIWTHVKLTLVVAVFPAVLPQSATQNR